MIDDTVFNILSNRIKQMSGIVITKDKIYLLESRLLPVMRKHNIAGLPALAQHFQQHQTSPLVEDSIDAMTTNETLFFRDNTPFNTMREVVLPYLLENRKNKKSFRIWSAAASTGQEAYSLVMMFTEMAAKLQGWTYQILGTDLSTVALDKARAGVYSQFEVQRGMPIQMLLKYFQQNGDKWHLKDEIKSKVKFQSFNLLHSPSLLGTFDIVFLRNVLIYFDPPTKREILERVSKIMAPDGFLFLGGAETIIGVTDAFRSYPNTRGLYQVTPNSERAATPPATSTIAAPVAAAAK